MKKSSVILMSVLASACMAALANESSQEPVALQPLEPVAVADPNAAAVDESPQRWFVELSGAPLELNAQVLEHIRRFFTARRRVMAPRNELQAMFPRGSVVIPNPHGTAPGIEMSLVRS
ncbi:MAG: hypothetical protein KY442_07390, partial [Proteobacteria bacterium]|nr:hypothetical protein [Pseudomonadota bacterium]